MNDIVLEMVTYFILAVIFITLVLNVIQVLRNNKIKKQLTKLEKEKNQIVNASIVNELTKVENLLTNEKITEQYNKWQECLNNIKKQEVSSIEDLLLEVDFLLEKKQYNNVLDRIANVEIKLYEARSKSNHLLSEIKEITQSEEKNRKIITKLKATYRELIHTFETTIEAYGEIANPIRLQFENIEKRFHKFEQAMENNEYEEVKCIVNALDNMIRHMEVVIEEVPSIVLTVENIIPKRINEIIEEYETMLKHNYQLDYLNVEYNIEEINKKINDIMVRVNVLNLEDILFELKTFLGYFDNLFNDFEREKLTKKVFEENILLFKNKIINLRKIIDEIYNQVSDIKGSYDLSNNDLSSIDELNIKLTRISDDFKALNETVETNSFPYSKLNKELEMLSVKLGKLEEDIEDVTQSIGSMKDDEKRAREQLNNIKDLLKQAKYKIREYKIPIIPDNYFVELKEAQVAIKNIVKELEKKPINIEDLNTRVDTARDLVFKLYNTTNEMIKTAIMAEKAIVYGNRYKSVKKAIYDGLNKAEILFIKGDYKKSLELSIDTIDIIESDI